MHFECKNLTAGYGRLDILFDVSAAFEGGTVTSIIGPNGAGKSTLLKALYGVARMRGGDVLLDGQSIVPIDTSKMVSRGIGYVPQLSNVFPSLSVEENLEIGTYSTRSGKVDFDPVLAVFPALRGLMKKPAGRLSGGQRTMVAVGRALMSSPEILLVDEPTAGLAPLAADSLWKDLRALASMGVGVVVVEQNVRLALSNSDDVYLLGSGRNVLHTSASSLSDRDDLDRLFLESEKGENRNEVTIPK